MLTIKTQIDRLNFVEGNRMSETTKAGKSSPSIPVVVEALTPLISEGLHVRGAKRWLDGGCPDNTSTEYPGWVQK